jgi:hypothetical protein
MMAGPEVDAHRILSQSRRGGNVYALHGNLTVIMGFDDKQS